MPFSGSTLSIEVLHVPWPSQDIFSKSLFTVRKFLLNCFANYFLIFVSCINSNSFSTKTERGKSHFIVISLSNAIYLSKQSLNYLYNQLLIVSSSISKPSLKSLFWNSLRWHKKSKQRPSNVHDIDITLDGRWNNVVWLVGTDAINPLLYSSFMFIFHFIDFH